MQPRFLLSLALVSPLLTAQGVERIPASSIPSSAASSELSFAPPPGAPVAVDRLPDGSVWATADDYKARFDRDGATFYPFLGSRVPGHHSATFRALGARVADRVLTCGSADAKLGGDRVTFHHGGFREVYALRAAGVEQMFAFDALPARGELVVSVGVDTALEVRADAGGFAFEGPFGGFRYGRAVAFDARGQRVEVSARRSAEGLELTVPESFVRAAELPLWIDPLVGYVTALPGSSRELRASDIAYDASLDAYVVCWERVFSLTDSDVFAAILDGSMQPLVGSIIIDISAASWRACHVATVEGSDRALVVAEVSSAGTAPFWVGGRALTGLPTAALGAPFDVVRDSVRSDLAPDVGGTAEAGPSGSFLVVWEREYSPTDHDIHFRLVGADGALGTLRSLDASVTYAERPVVSSNPGTGSPATQGWAVVYRRHLQGGTDGELRLGIVQPDGTIRALGGANHVAVGAPTPLAGTSFAVSSPTHQELGRVYLVVEQRDVPQSAQDSMGVTAVDASGAVLDYDNWFYAAGSSYGAVAVDSDGCRFTVAHETLSLSGANPTALMVEAVRFANGTLRYDGSSWLGHATRPRTGPSVVGARGALPNRFGVSFAALTAPSTWAVECTRYDSIADHGGGAIRPTGCGGIGISVAGDAALGESLSVQHTANDGLRGFLAGVPVQIPLPFCSGCSVGADGVTLQGVAHHFVVPCNPGLVGVTLAFQGYRVVLPGTGTCLGSIDLSDTIDVTFR